MGLIISPLITIVSFIQPKALFAFGGGGGGVIMATGSPRFVTIKDSPLAFTRSSKARQVALNFEIAICSIVHPFFSDYFTMVNYHGQLRIDARNFSIQDIELFPLIAIRY